MSELLIVALIVAVVVVVVLFLYRDRLKTFSMSYGDAKTELETYKKVPEDSSVEPKEKNMERIKDVTQESKEGSNKLVINGKSLEVENIKQLGNKNNSMTIGNP